MSKIGKRPIPLPEGVRVTVHGDEVVVEAVSYTHLTLPTTPYV